MAACGGNFAAVRAACAAGLARIPDWLPDCAYDATLQTGGYVGALRFFLEQPQCRGARSWWRLWRRLRAAQADPRRRLQLAPAQEEWLRRRQEWQEARERRLGRGGLCGVLRGLLTRVCGGRGAGGGVGGGTNDGGETSEEELEEDRKDP